MGRTKITKKDIAYYNRHYKTDSMPVVSKYYERIIEGYKNEGAFAVGSLEHQSNNR